jgi:hypothetical protein
MSALDMYALLLFSFLALAFLVHHGVSGPAELPLPIVRGAKTSGRSATDTALFVAWASDADVRGAKGAYCNVSIREGSLKAPEVITKVPCWPGAFEQGQKLTVSDRLRTAAARRFRAIAVCPRGKVTLEACARMTYMLYEHDFESVATYVEGLR